MIPPVHTYKVTDGVVIEQDEQFIRVTHEDLPGLIERLREIRMLHLVGSDMDVIGSPLNGDQIDKLMADGSP